MNTLISMVRIRIVIKASRGGHRLFLGRKILFVSLWKCLFLQLCPWGWSFMPWTLFIGSCIYVVHIRMYHLGLCCAAWGLSAEKGTHLKLSFPRGSSKFVWSLAVLFCFHRGPFPVIRRGMCVCVWRGLGGDWFKNIKKQKLYLIPAT